MIGAVAIACWVMTGFKLRHLVRDPRNPALRYLCLTLASLSLSLSLNPFDAALDRIVGTRDVGMVTGNCLVVIAAGAAQAVLMYLPGTGDDVRWRVRNRNVVMLACVALLVAVFVLTPTPTPAAAGSLLGVCYATVRVIEHTLKLAALEVLITPLYTTTTATLLVAATIPSWGARIGLDRAWANLSARQDCRRLQPLWDLVYRAVPEVALLPHPTRPPLRRVRMIVEILDGYV